MKVLPMFLSLSGLVCLASVSYAGGKKPPQPNNVSFTLKNYSPVSLHAVVTLGPGSSTSIDVPAGLPSTGQPGLGTGVVVAGGQTSYGLYVSFTDTATGAGSACGLSISADSSGKPNNPVGADIYYDAGPGYKCYAY